MALDRTAIENALRDAIATAAGAYDDPATFDEAKIVHANQNAPQPREPFAVINCWVASGRRGRDEERLDDDAPGIIQHAGNRRLTVSLNIYGPGALELADRIAERLMTQAIAEGNLDPAGLAILRTSDPRNLTALLETRYQERAQLDLTVGCVSNWTEDVGYITSVGIEGDLVADNGATLPTDTTIP